ADAIYPIFFGEDTSSGVNQFQLAFIDTRAGVLGSNYADYASLMDKGAVKVEYTFTNLTGYAAFNLYAWNNATNNGQGMGWTNRVSGDGSSGYSVNAVPSSSVPVAVYTATPNAGKAPLTVQFTDASTNSPTSWLWKFGDGGTSTLQNPVHTYSSSGTFTVNLTVLNAAGTSSLVKSGYITTLAPVTAFIASTTSGSAPLAVQFTDQSTGYPTSWYWEFGDGSTSTAQNPSHTYASSGSATTTYTVNLTATNAVGSTSVSKSNYITVASSTPIVSFNGTPRTSGVYPLTVRFRDTSLLGPTSWYWDFGDGTTSTEQNPSHTYTAVGSYTVNLTATNVIGSANVSKPGYINIVTPGPINTAYPYLYVANDEGVKYDINGTNPTYVPNTYSFATMGGLNALHISSGAATSDVTTTTNQSGTFYFTHTGGQPTVPDGILMLAVNGTIPDDFSVHIRSSGDNWTPSGPSYVNGGAPTEWNYAEGAVDQTFAKDDFIYGPQSWKPCSGDSYPIYHGEDLSDPINQFRIMFIDLYAGKAYDNIKIEYEFHNLTSFAAFNAYGWYLASNHGTMIMTNDVEGGSTYGASGYSVIGIPDAPVAGFTASTTSENILVPIQFTDTSANVPQFWSWDFGDGTTSIEQNPSHAYNNAGTYTVTLTAVNLKGSDSAAQPITITVPTGPVANFTADVTSGISPLAVQFNDTSSNLPFIWYWDFGDGTNSTVQNPVHWYAPGNYSVNLTVTNGGGSSSLLKNNLISVGSNGRSNQFSNPGFETGDLKGWTAGAATSVSTTQKHNGNNAVYFPVAHLSTTYISQYVDLTNITNISFWGYQDGSMDSTTYPQYFYTYIDGVQVQTDSCAHAWTQYTVPSSRYTGIHLVQVTFEMHSIGMSAYADDFFAGLPTAPVASFSSNTSTGTYPLAVQFTDSSTNTPTAWLWDFGDNSTSAVQNPTHVYTTAGSFSVNLTVTGAGGISDSTIRIVMVNTPPAVVTNFTSNVTYGNYPLSVQFTDMSTGSPTAWEWNFGDGSTNSTVQNAMHTYSAGGSYTVTLTASNSGLTNSTTQTGYIKIPVILPGQTRQPTAPGGDGLYTDLNGNGYLDFNDVQVYFRQMDYLSSSEPVALFDINRNGYIDFNDVQLIFRRI
ncbi:MAG: PKD domain-containing protein, partial [Methanoregula sp.]